MGSVRVEGLRELRSTIRRIDEGRGQVGRDRVGLLGFREHVKGAAQIVADEAQNRAPVDTGKLRSSIRARASGDRGLIVALARNPRNNYRYPRRLEYERGGARAFMGPALEAKADDVQKEMEKVLDTIEKAWGK